MDNFLNSQLVRNAKFRLILFLSMFLLPANLSAQSSMGTAPVVTPGVAKTISAVQGSRFLFAAAPAPIISVSGRVLNSTGKPGAEATVSLIPRDPNVSLPIQRTSQTDARGNFTIRGVLPGAYLLVAKLKQESQEYWAEKKIDVLDADISGVDLQLSADVNLTGSVHAIGGHTLDYGRLTVRLSPEDGNSADVTAEVAGDGAFSLTELRLTTLRLQLIGLPDDWYLRSAVWGNQDVLKSGLNLGEADKAGPLKLTVSVGAGRLQGVVLEPASGDSVPNAIVKLFPDPANPHRLDLFRSGTTDKDGRFTLRNVVPGRYRVLAFMGRGSADYSYDDSLTAAGAGTRVTISENQSKNIELTIFEAHR